MSGGPGALPVYCYCDGCDTAISDARLVVTHGSNGPRFCSSRCSTLWPPQGAQLERRDASRKARLDTVLTTS